MSLFQMVDFTRTAQSQHMDALSGCAGIGFAHHPAPTGTQINEVQGPHTISSNTFGQRKAQHDR